MDYEIEDFEIENELEIEDLDVDVAYVGESVKQIYIGNTEPTDSNILIWIDTSEETPITNTQLLTKDNKEFITSNNESFILKEE